MNFCEKFIEKWKKRVKFCLWAILGSPKSIIKRSLVGFLLSGIIFSRLFFGLHSVSQLILGAFWGYFQITLIGNLRRIYEPRIMALVCTIKVNTKGRFKVFVW